MIPLGVYTRYAVSGASSRLRYLRYIDTLRRNGFDARVHPLLSDRYLKKLYEGRSAGAEAVCSEALRLLRLPWAEPNLWIEYELLPFLPFALETSLIGKRRCVLNFDDAVYLKYRGKKHLDGKYERLAERAAGVMAANDALLEHFSRVNPNTVKIPTAVDTEALRPTERKFGRFTIGWIGTPVTFRAHLAPFLPMLGEISDEVDFELLAIGAPPEALRGLRWARSLPWSEETERDALPRCHAGIMPLPDRDDFAAGKSAYKLLQYLAAGLPSVASPVGENRVVVKPGTTGFAATTRDEWRTALHDLASDEALRRGMSENARRDSENYSVKRFAPGIVKFLKKSFSGT